MTKESIFLELSEGIIMGCGTKRTQQTKIVVMQVDSKKVNTKEVVSN